VAQLVEEDVADEVGGQEEEVLVEADRLVS
jgi:hypothetical protein